MSTFILQRSHRLGNVSVLVRGMMHPFLGVVAFAVLLYSGQRHAWAILSGLLVAGNGAVGGDGVALLAYKRKPLVDDVDARRG